MPPSVTLGGLACWNLNLRSRRCFPGSERTHTPTPAAEPLLRSEGDTQKTPAGEGPCTAWPLCPQLFSSSLPDCDTDVGAGHRVPKAT